MDQDKTAEFVQYRIEKNLNYAEALHQFADWVANNASVVEMPWRIYVDAFIYDDPDLPTAKSQLADVARAAGHAEKFSEYGTFGIRRWWGDDQLVRYSLGTSQEQTCNKRVVEVRTVTKKRLPEDFEYETYEVEEEVVEWDCPPLLAQ